jgi:hypothetical protein
MTFPLVGESGQGPRGLPLVTLTPRYGISQRQLAGGDAARTGSALELDQRRSRFGADRDRRAGGFGLW